MQPFFLCFGFSEVTLALGYKSWTDVVPTASASTVMEKFLCKIKARDAAVKKKQSVMLFNTEH